MKTAADFVAALRDALVETYEKQPPSDRAVRTWLAAIKHTGLTWEQAIDGLIRHICDPTAGRFPPKPADVIRNIRGDRSDALTEIESNAMVQWGIVLEAINRVSTYKSVVFDDWRTMTGIQACGGWREIGMAHTDNLQVMQATFRRAYVGAKYGAHPTLHQGIHAAGPVMIGDARKCLEVAATGRRALLTTTAPIERQLPEPKEAGKLLQFAPQKQE